MNCEFRETQQHTVIHKSAFVTQSKKQQLFPWPHCHPVEKCVISACLQIWHTCSSSFAVMFAFKKPGGCQPLSQAVTERRIKPEKRKKWRSKRGEAEKKSATVCAILPEISDWFTAVVAAYLKKWAFTWVYNREYITYTVASLYPWRLPSAPHWFTHS